MFKLSIFAMLSFIILYITNPSQEDFTNFYTKKINKEKKDETFSNKILLESKKIYAKMTVERKDRYIYSVYSVEFSGEKEIYIGILKKFILKDKVKVPEIEAIRTYNKIIEKTEQVIEKASGKAGEVSETTSQ